VIDLIPPPVIRIIIVEDDAIINRHLQTCLLKVGYEVVGSTAEGGKALILVEEVKPDLVLMDISLYGDMDGVQTAEQIRDRFDIPIIFLTAFADELTLKRAKATNPFGYILKPFDQRSLYTTIEMAVHKHQLEKRLRESEELLRTLVENQGEGVVIVDTEETFTFINPAAEAIFAAPNGVLIGRNLGEFTTPEMFEQVRKQTTLRRQGLKSVYELEITRLDGEKRIVSVTATPWFDKFANFSGAYGILSDITERKRIEAAEREQRTLAEALRETAVLLSSTLEVNEVLDRILDYVGQVVPHDNATLMILEGDFVSVFLPRRGNHHRGQVSQSNLNFCWKEYRFFQRLYETGEPSVLTDPAELRELPDFSQMKRLKSFVSAPLKIKNQIIGFINLGSLTSNYYNEKHAERLFAFSSQAALALENAHLFDELQQRASYLSLLNEITQSAIHTSNLNETLQVISRKMALLFHSDGAYITIWDDQTQLSIPASAYGLDGEIYTTIPAKPGERTLTYSVLEVGHSLVVEDVRRSPYIEPELALTYPLQTLLGLPLISDGQKLGAVIIGFVQPHRFTQEEIERGEQAARQIALAIAKTRFYTEIQRLAITDELSNVLNRRGIFEMGQKAVETAHALSQPLSLLWLDIDHFKSFNDTFGHHIGDEIVKEIANRIRSALREQDIVGRYGGEGGDEYIILLPNTEMDDARLVGDRLRRKIGEEPVVTSKGEHYVTVSIGATKLRGNAEPFAALLARADETMYAAKNAGRDCVVLQE